MKIIGMIVFGMIFFTQLSAQSNDEDFRYGKGGKLLQGSKVLKPNEVLRIMEPNPEAHVAFKKAKANYDAANVFAFMGGALIGYPLGTAIGGGDPQWGLAAGGAALLLVIIPLQRGFKKNATLAFDLYNNKKPSTAQRLEPRMYIGLHGTGVGMSLKF